MKKLKTLKIHKNQNYIELYSYEKTEDILSCFIDKSRFMIFLNIYFEEEIIKYFNLNQVKEYKGLISVYVKNVIQLHTSPENKNQIRERLSAEPWDFSCVVLKNRNGKLEIEYLIRQVEGDDGFGIKIKEINEGNFNKDILPKVKFHFSIQEIE